MRKQKTWKQIEDSRNARLWITSVVLPLAGMATTLYLGVPEIRYAINDIPNKVKQGINKLKRRVTIKTMKESK